MKKMVSVVLATLMLIASMTCAFGQELVNEASGISITIPEGFSYEDASEGDTSRLIIVDDNVAELAYVYQVVYIEELDGIWLEDLTEEQVQVLAQSAADTAGSLVYDVIEAEGIYYVLFQAEDSTVAGAMYLLDGWFCSLIAVVADGHQVTELVWEDIDTLLMGITFAE